MSNACKPSALEILNAPVKHGIYQLQRRKGGLILKIPACTANSFGPKDEEFVVIQIGDIELEVMKSKATRDNAWGVAQVVTVSEAQLRSESGRAKIAFILVNDKNRFELKSEEVEVDLGRLRHLVHG